MNSISLIFGHNFRVTKRSSAGLSLRTGVNFSPYLLKADLAFASIIFED